MLYREQRGALAKSMETVKEYDTFEELKEDIRQNYIGYDTIDDIEFEYVGYDERINWDTYYIKVKFTNQNNYVISGMTNGKFE